jgi:ElaB/YqjD/DUF883 family membrane-anchored ribosome-binding protein
MFGSVCAPGILYEQLAGTSSVLIPFVQEGVTKMSQFYGESVPGATQDTQDNPSNLVNKLTSAVNETKSKLQQMGHNVQAKIDGTRGPTADKLKSTASRIHEKADKLPGGDKVAGFAHCAADKLQATADYVREHDAQAMMAEVEGYVRKHPGRSLLAATAAGLLIGRAFRRRY